jgi:hypothetical protein
MATESALNPYTFLDRMPQQPGLLGDDEDWTGFSSSTKRRKLQNRINQRARRKFSRCL